MADVKVTKFVYPANWPGTDPGPDGPGNRKVEILLTFTSAGTTGETDVEVIDPADWRLPGQPGTCDLATRIGILAVDATINKIDYVTISWERNPTERALVLPMGKTNLCFNPAGLCDDSDGVSDNTGRLRLSSVGVVDKGSYIIRLLCEIRG